MRFNTDQCDFFHEGDKPIAVDSHGGEVFFCEEHRPLVLEAFRRGILDNPHYTIAEIERIEEENK